MFVFLTNDLNLFITLSLTIKQVKLERSNVLINKFIYRRLNVCMCVLDCKFFCNKINKNFSIFLYLNVRQNLWNNILLIIIMLIVKEIGFMKLTFHYFHIFYCISFMEFSTIVFIDKFQRKLVPILTLTLIAKEKQSINCF